MKQSPPRQTPPGWRGRPWGELEGEFKRVGAWVERPGYVRAGGRVERLLLTVPGSVRKKLVCARCGRVLDVLVPGYWAPTVRSAWAGERGAAKPTMHREEAYPPDLEPGWKGVTRWHRQCHRRCGADYTMRMERLVEAFVEACADGRDRIVAGRDV